jgi:Ricin-type beta-trefoil lectin domain
MKAERRASRRLWAFLAATISAVIIGAASMPAALAASTAAPGAASKLTYCGSLRVTAGPWDAIDSNLNRNLTWDEASGPHANDVVSLHAYSGSAEECWKVLGGFGNSRLEIQDTHGLCLSANRIDPKFAGVPMVLEACRSQTNTLFTFYTVNTFRLVEDPALCVGLDGAIKQGTVLYQQRCNTSSSSQRWHINENP